MDDLHCHWHLFSQTQKNALGQHSSSANGKIAQNHEDQSHGKNVQTSQSMTFPAPVLSILQI